MNNLLANGTTTATTTSGGSGGGGGGSGKTDRNGDHKKQTPEEIALAKVAEAEKRRLELEDGLPLVSHKSQRTFFCIYIYFVCGCVGVWMCECVFLSNYKK